MADVAISDARSLNGSGSAPMALQDPQQRCTHQVEQRKADKQRVVADTVCKTAHHEGETQPTDPGGRTAQPRYRGYGTSVEQVGGKGE